MRPGRLAFLSVMCFAFVFGKGAPDLFSHADPNDMSLLQCEHDINAPACQDAYVHCSHVDTRLYVLNVNSFYARALIV